MHEDESELADLVHRIGANLGALEECPHGEFLSTDDADAVQRTYATVTKMWKQGELSYPRERLMEAVKDYVENAGDECYTCSRNEHE